HPGRAAHYPAAPQQATAGSLEFLHVVLLLYSASGVRGRRPANDGAVKLLSAVKRARKAQWRWELPGGQEGSRPERPLSIARLKNGSINRRAYSMGLPGSGAEFTAAYSVTLAARLVDSNRSRSAACPGPRPVSGARPAASPS